jgi:hypothetical protein
MLRPGVALSVDPTSPPKKWHAVAAKPGADMLRWMTPLLIAMFAPG